MYFLNTSYYLYNTEKRKILMSLSKQISEQEKVPQVKVIADMIWCAVRYGTMWTEYGDMGFFYRSSQNRATYITTFYNFKLYNKLNQKSERRTFHEKIKFLETFSEFISRSWIKTEGLSDEQIADYLISHRNVVAKASYGDSGKEVEVINISDEDDIAAIVHHIHEQHYNLIEEQIFNHQQIRKLNPSSLNTLRFVTVAGAKKVHILFAGIRVGGKGAKIDNISQGGRVARIDIDAGKINSPFFAKASTQNLYSMDDNDLDVIGYPIPFWDKVLETVKNAALVVPQIRIVAWDVAITEKGTIELVEGNESFGSVIMQLYYKYDEPGVKPMLLKILEDE